MEIQDDTPEEDRGRSRADNTDAKPAEKSSEAQVEKSSKPEDSTADDDDDDLSKHSESVQKRIKKLKYEYHEERRRKEAADRERETAIEYAEKVKRENDNLRKNLTDGEGVLITQAKARVMSELSTAKAEYKQAYEAGDADAIIEAQSKLVRLQTESDRIEGWKPQERKAQTPEPVARPNIPQPDPKVKAWVEKNEWFHTNPSMKRYALLVHEELVESGVDQTSDLYYKKIDDAMRQRYPDRFGVVEDEVTRAQPKTGSVVAPGGRNTATPRKKVTLTSSEAALAKRLGLTNKEYAAQKLKDMEND